MKCNERISTRKSLILHLKSINKIRNWVENGGTVTVYDIDPFCDYVFGECDFVLSETIVATIGKVTLGMNETPIVKIHRVKNKMVAEWSILSQIKFSS